MQDTKKPETTYKRLLVIILVFIVILLQMAIIIPSLHFPGRKKYCYKVHADARKIAAAITDYLADPKHMDVRPSDIEKFVGNVNPWTFAIKSDEIVIQVTDSSGKCPAEFQTEHPDWRSGIYTYRIILKNDP
jgi:hypothetical protein